MKLWCPVKGPNHRWSDVRSQITMGVWTYLPVHRNRQRLKQSKPVPRSQDWVAQVMPTEVIQVTQILCGRLLSRKFCIIRTDNIDQSRKKKKGDANRKKTSTAGAQPWQQASAEQQSGFPDQVDLLLSCLLKPQNKWQMARSREKLMITTYTWTDSTACVGVCSFVHIGRKTCAPWQLDIGFRL